MKPFKDFAKGAKIYLYMHGHKYLHPDILSSVCGELPAEGKYESTSKVPSPKAEPKARRGHPQSEDSQQVLLLHKSKTKKNKEIK